MYEIPNGAKPTKHEIDAINNSSMSMTCWNSVPLCHAPIISSIYDAFLTDVINDTEFSCKYYYEEGCRFQGKGNGLHEHEEGHVKKSEPERKESVEHKIKTKTVDDDAAILSYNLTEALAKADKLYQETLKKHGSKIDKKSSPPIDTRGGGRKKR